MLNLNSFDDCSDAKRMLLNVARMESNLKLKNLGIDIPVPTPVFSFTRECLKNALLDHSITVEQHDFYASQISALESALRGACHV